MVNLNFKYSMKLNYEKDVNPCYFTIKCIPMNTDRQELLEIDIQMDPDAEYCYSADSLGNQKIIGAIYKPHNYYYLDVCGKVRINQVLYEEYYDPDSIGMYKYSHGKVRYGEKINQYSELVSKELISSGIEKNYDKVLSVMHMLHRDFHYEKGLTDVHTDSETAMSIGSGVCQDYAHIFIALIRKLEIPARYVSGLLIGEGESHAWCEVLIKDKWIGFDPTNDLLVDDNYIKLCHGRDSDDSKINLGIMFGGGEQTQSIEVNVWKEDND